MTISDDLRSAKSDCPLRGTRYHARRLIGSGAVADVYEAVDPSGELRAVKVLRGLLATARAAARFAREARALASVTHPNVVPLLDAGVTARGTPYMVMPRLQGETLRELIRTGPIEASRAGSLLAGALDGLEAAHAVGIVHRDVKPANVFVVHACGGGDERSIVLAFGIAKLCDGSVVTSTGGHVLGTPRYLSPEQILGGTIDARTDVYAMGLVAFETLAGHSPYSAVDWLGWMRAHVHDTPRRLRDVGPFDGAVDEIVARALEKAPAARWSSARAFAEALRTAARCS